MILLIQLTIQPVYQCIEATNTGCSRTCLAAGEVPSLRMQTINRKCTEVTSGSPQAVDSGLCGDCASSTTPCSIVPPCPGPTGTPSEPTPDPSLVPTLSPTILTPEPTPSPRPDPSRSPTVTECAYSTNPWHGCSVTCGPGVRSRSMDCFCRGVAVASAQCEARGLARPLEIESCTGKECPHNYLWKANPWSGCVKGCVRTRTLECERSESGIAVENARCEEAGTPKPAHSEQCIPRECSGLKGYAPVKDMSTGITIATTSWTALMVLCLAPNFIF